MTPKKFIDDFKKRFPDELEQIFYHGYCYWFATILSLRFEGEIWFNPAMVHFASKIKDDLYDIFGKVNPGVDPYTGIYDKDFDQWYRWEDYQECHQEEIESITASCIRKEKGATDG